MDSFKFLIRTLAAGAIVATSALAQAASLPQVHVTAADYAAVATRTHVFISATPVGTLGSGVSKLRSDSAALGGLSKHGGGSGGNGAQFPGDLGDLFGGATIPTAVNHPLYLVSSNGSSCFASGFTLANIVGCWGNVAQFLGDLFGSSFVHITDQYVGANGNGRYTVGSQWSGTYSAPAVTAANPQGALTDSDMAAYAHALARIVGAGYGHVIHLFLTPEQVTCFDSTYTVCSSNYFCAYHSSAYFSDIGEVVYTVEPYLVGVAGCNQPATSPNGPYDATYSVLSHEFFETVTDPDGGTWFNITDSSLLGSEIGDECLFWLFDSNGFFISANPVVQTFNHRSYAIQTEYNNAAHACTTRPGTLPE